MTPTACGRFCAVCQKEVIDVTQMDDSTILQKYSDNGGELCIRARAEQISPTITVRSFPMQRLAVFALAVWLVFAGGLVSEAVGQTDSVRTEVSVSDTNDCVLMVHVIDTENRSTDSVRVFIRREEDSTSIKGLTDPNGICIFRGLPAGDYMIHVKRNKYSSIGLNGQVSVCKGMLNQLTMRIISSDLMIIGGVGAIVKPDDDTRRLPNRVFDGNGQVQIFEHYKIGR